MLRRTPPRPYIPHIPPPSPSHTHTETFSLSFGEHTHASRVSSTKFTYARRHTNKLYITFLKHRAAFITHGEMFNPTLVSDGGDAKMQSNSAAQALCKKINAHTQPTSKPVPRVHAAISRLHNSARRMCVCVCAMHNIMIVCAAIATRTARALNCWLKVNAFVSRLAAGGGGGENGNGVRLHGCTH